MPIYHYQALDTRGKKRTGMMEGYSEKEAREKLREKGLMVTKVTEKTTMSARQNLTGDHLLGFTMLLGQLLNSNIPLYESLITIEEEYHQEPFHRVILSLCEQVKAGSSLSQAMAAYPQSFDKLYCSMITAGEVAGALPMIMDRLTHLLNKQSALQKKISTALIYPGILACFAFVVIIMLMGFVIPSIESIFADRELNGFTEFVLSISRFLRNYWWVYIPVIAGTGTWIYFKLQTPAGKLWLERFFLKLPIVKSLMINAAITRFCRTMSTLQLGGVSMIESLQLARETMNNHTMEEEIRIAENRVVEGGTLSAQIARSRLIPHMVPRMLAVGEETGNMIEMLSKISDIYEDEMEKYLDRLMALAQPVILIVMGLIIGMVLMAILLPLTDVSSLSSGT